MQERCSLRYRSGFKVHISVRPANADRLARLVGNEIVDRRFEEAVRDLRERRCHGGNSTGNHGGFRFRKTVYPAPSQADRIPETRTCLCRVCGESATALAER